MVIRRGYNRPNKITSSYKKYKAPVFGTKKVKKEIKFHLPSNFWRILIYFIGLCFIIYYLFFSNKFSIKEVLVEGNNLVVKDSISEMVTKGRNILFFNNSKTKNEILAKFPEIKSLEIYKGIPNAIKIVIVEREPKMVWQVGDDKYMISSQGEVMRKIFNEDISKLPLIIDKKSIRVVPGDVVVSPNFIAFISNVNDNFFTIVNIKPTYFEVTETTFDVNLYTEVGFYVKLNSLRSSKKQIESLKTILVEKRQEVKEYVDLRIDGWAYYK